MAAEIGFRPPAAEENAGILGRLWGEVWKWFARGWTTIDFVLEDHEDAATDALLTQLGATNFWYRSFDNAATRRAWCNIMVPNDYAIGTPIYLGVRWTPNTNGAGNVVWQMAYALAKGWNQAAFPFGAASTDTVTAAAPAVQYQHMLSLFTVISSGIEPNAMIAVRLVRDPAHASDTYAATAWGITMTLHYQRSRLGTKNKSPNFYS